MHAADLILVAGLLGLCLAPTPSRADDALTALQRAKVDSLVRDKIADAVEGIAKSCKLDQHLAALRKHQREYGSWKPAAGVGWCAKSLHDNGLAQPKSIDAAVESIVWQFDHPTGGSTPAERYYHRSECVRALGFIASPRGVPTILRFLSEAPPQKYLMGSMHWQGLQTMSDPRLLPFIDRAIDHLDQEDAGWCLQALEKMGPPAVPTLLRVARGSDRALQQQAAQSLLEIGGRDADAFLAKLSAEDADELGEAFKTYRARHADGRAPPNCGPSGLPSEDALRLRFLGKLAFSEEGGQAEAADALVDLGPLGAGVLHEHLLSHEHGDGRGGPSFHVSQRAAELLQRVGRPAVPCLIDGLLAQHAAHRSADALVKVTGQDFGADYPAWRRWYLALSP